MYRIAINSIPTGKLAQGDPLWATFNDSFVNRELEAIDVANEIYMGHAYTAWCEGRRKKENFICGQHLAVDLDTGDARSSLDVLEQHELVQMYGGIIHTTPSHAPQSPRARVIFFLNEPINSPTGYSAASEFIASLFDGADTVCKDPARFFYGAKNCDLRLVMRELPVAQLRVFFARYGKQGKAKQKPQQGIIRLNDYRQRGETDNGMLERLASHVAAAPQGSRNDTLNKAAFIAGKMVGKGEATATDAERAIKDAASMVGLDKTEIAKTFNSGFNSGRKAV